MKINASHLALQVAIMTTLLLASVSIACGIDGETDTQVDSVPTNPATTSYLRSTVEPCQPVLGSDLDPCERRLDDWDRTRSPYRSASYPKPVEPPTIEASLTAAFDSPLRIPHLIVRGTVLPDSTRCEEQDRILVSAYGFEPKVREGPWDTCFSELRVGEYIVG